MKNLLPRLMIRLTGMSRYRRDFKWRNDSWTHNVFRFYELVFWRRYGVRPELSGRRYQDENGNWRVVLACHTWESAISLMEIYVREFISLRKLLPFKIYIPMMMTGEGVPVFPSPYLFALALDTVSENISGSGFSAVFASVSGCVVSLWMGTGAGSNFSSVTIGGNAMSLVIQTNIPTDGKQWCYLLVGPPTGSQTFAQTGGSGPSVSWISFSGALQSSQPDASGSNTSAAGLTISCTVTTVTNNSFLALQGIAGGTPHSTNLANFDTGSDIGYGGPVTPAGAQTCTFNWTGASVHNSIIAVAIAPAAVVAGLDYLQAPTQPTNHYRPTWSSA